LLTLLKVSHPRWVREIDCCWNFQLDKAMADHALFPKYHVCDSEPKVLHGNGGATIPTESSMPSSSSLPSSEQNWTSKK
jgi:hypothetical protein